MATKTSLTPRTRDEIRKDINAGIDAVNGMIDRKVDHGTIDAKLASLNTLMTEYNLAIRDGVYLNLSQAENPMLEAIESLLYKKCKISMKRDHETDELLSCKVSTANANLKFLEFKKFCENRHIECGVASDWANKVEEFNYLFAVYVAKSVTDIPLKVREKDYVKKIITRIEESKSDANKKNPTSEKSMCDALQDVIDRMVYIPELDKKGVEHNKLKVTTKDVKALRDIFTRHGTKLYTISTINRDSFAFAIAEMVNAKMNGVPYSVIFEGQEPKKNPKDKTPSVEDSISIDITGFNEEDSDPDESNDSKELK